MGLPAASCTFRQHYPQDMPFWEVPTLKREIQTGLFGRVRIDEDRILTFPDGLVGFEDCREFFLVDFDPSLPPMKYLQSAELPDLTFVVADPGVLFERYEPPLPREELAKIDLKGRNEALILVIVVVPENDLSHMTANLKAPLVVNPERRLGRQIITPSDDYSIKHRLFPEGDDRFGRDFKKALLGD